MRGQLVSKQVLRRLGPGLPGHENTKEFAGCGDGIGDAHGQHDPVLLASVVLLSYHSRTAFRFLMDALAPHRNRQLNGRNMRFGLEGQYCMSLSLPKAFQVQKEYFRCNRRSPLDKRICDLGGRRRLLECAISFFVRNLAVRPNHIFPLAFKASTSRWRH